MRRVKFILFLFHDFFFIPKRRILNNDDKKILFMKRFFFFLKKTFVGKDHTLPCVLQPASCVLFRDPLSWRVVQW